ncbi:MAG: DNA replication and repair protein RecF [Firmicutes bacterium]|nr:DNA replication and repair protein RecF [Bacillota bacterium]
MNIERLSLRDFRNYRAAEVCPGRGLNVLYGGNAEGKTNLLESLIVASSGRSTRAAHDRELIRWGADAYRVYVEVAGHTGAATIEVGADGAGGKVTRINGADKKAADLLALFSVVSFFPDDVYVVKGPPSLRRRMIDLTLSRTSRSYHYRLIEYYRILAQRNSLLRQWTDRRPPERLLAPWDEQLARAGAFIVRRRLEALGAMSDEAGRAYSRLSGGEALELRYEPSVGAEAADDEERIGERILAALRGARDEEMRRGVTTVGPHRDDVAFMIGGADARVFGSQGQQRTIVLAVKAAEVQFLESRTGDSPVLILATYSRSSTIVARIPL